MLLKGPAERWLQEPVKNSTLDAGVATSGVAESFIGASHVKRTQYAHIVTAASLFICQQHAHSKYCDDIPIPNTMSYVEWCSEKCKTSV